MNNLGGAHYSTERDRYSRRGSSIRSTRSDLGSRETAVAFPLVPYLQIDFSEISIYIVFFLFGPLAALISSVVQWIFLNMTGSDAPPGPPIKFVAVVSTLGGLWLGSSVYGRIKGKMAHPSLAILMMFVSGIV